MSQKVYAFGGDTQHIPVSKEKFRPLEGFRMNSMKPIIDQSRANLDEKILFGKIKHL